MSVLLGRWVGVLRALIPAVVGDAGMPYRSFLLWNALGAVAWSPALIFAGYLAGSSYQRVEHYLGPGSLMLGAIAAAAVVVWFLHRDRRHEPTAEVEGDPSSG